MKTGTIRDLKHDFSKIEAWIHQGEKIQVSKRGVPLMEISPVRKSSQVKKQPERIDFRAVQKRIWQGERFFSQEEIGRMLSMTEKEEFLTFDQKQREIAEAEGLHVPF